MSKPEVTKLFEKLVITGRVKYAAYENPTAMDGTPSAPYITIIPDEGSKALLLSAVKAVVKNADVRGVKLAKRELVFGQSKEGEDKDGNDIKVPSLKVKFGAVGDSIPLVGPYNEESQLRGSPLVKVGISVFIAEKVKHPSHVQPVVKGRGIRILELGTVNSSNDLSDLEDDLDY